MVPVRIPTDGHDAYPRAIRAVFGDQVTHRTTRYLNNHLEQDHRGIKQRYRSTGGLRTVRTAAQFWVVFNELRAFLRPQLCHNQRLSLAKRRALHQERLIRLMGILAAA